jgi:hypothetical protein
LLRFPNPGSNVDNLLKCFIFLYNNIKNTEVFGLHDMQELLVSNGLISSSGTMGVEALLKGASKDLSRDKSYNQCKMYAECYRFLGLIQSGEKALEYNFTLLGEHVATASTEKFSLLEQCFIGIEYPNEVLEVKGNHRLRPFYTILKTMYEMNGVLSRDEIILGPLSLDNDQDEEQYKQMLQKLKYLRLNPKEFENEIKLLLDKRKISRTTAGNYTRLPLGALRWLRWAAPISDNENYKKRTKTYKITEYGTKTAIKLLNKKDIRLDEIKKNNYPLKSISINSFYSMLKNSGFDIEPVLTQYNSEAENIEKHGLSKNLIFSPFQVLNRNILSHIFEIDIPTAKRKSIYSPSEIDDVTSSIDQVKTKLTASLLEIEDVDLRDNDFSRKVKSLIPSHTDSEIVKKLKESYKSYNKDKFYPLIGDIFNSIGLKCEIPPHGVNSRRWDAIIKAPDDSIPIEIKSPSEEMHLSVKAIRQALENKIILQSRQAEYNQRQTSSFAIGFELPNKRSEVTGLINDIKITYDIDIAVICIDVLLNKSVHIIRNGLSLEFSALSNLNGIINE